MRPGISGRVMAGICAVGITVSLGVAPAAAAFPGTNGRLAFEGGGGISTVRADGTGLKLGVRDGFGPAWSPDGKRIAFERQAPDGFTHIWVKNIVTGRQIQVTSNPRNDEDPAWSPDGTKIAFVTSGDIYSIRSTRPFGSRHLVLATPPSDWATDLAWSPDGARIAFDYYVDGSGDNIAVIEVGERGAAPIVLTSDGYDTAPTWSPSGTKIAYSSGWLSVMNADGTGKRHFSNNESTIFNLAWSPDGGKVAAVIEWQYTTVIITMNPWTGAWINDDVAADVGDGLDWQPIPR